MNLPLETYPETVHSYNDTNNDQHHVPNFLPWYQNHKWSHPPEKHWHPFQFRILDCQKNKINNKKYSQGELIKLPSQSGISLLLKFPGRNLTKTDKIYLFWNSIIGPSNWKSILKTFRIKEVHPIKHNAVDCIAAINKNHYPIYNNCP